MGRNPAMQLYVNDWLSSPRILCMAPLEELAYFRMLLFCWASGDCSITSNLEDLGRLTRTDSNTCSTVVQQAFSEHPTKPQFLTNERLYELWIERVNFAEQRRQAGIKSYEARSKSASNKRSTRVQQALNSSSLSLSSSNNNPLPLLPSVLDCEEFRAAWSDWMHHRSEIRKPVKPTQAESMLKQMASWGVSRSVAAIRHTITMGWIGLREPESEGHAGANGTRRPVIHSADVAKELAKDWRP